MLQLLTSSLVISNQDELVKPDEERDRRVLHHKYQQLRDRYAQLVYLAGQSDSPTGSSSVVRDSVVSESECRQYNTRLMRVMINKKMRKSPTFSEFLLGKNNSSIVGTHKPVPPPEGIAFDFFS